MSTVYFSVWTWLWWVILLALPSIDLFTWPSIRSTIHPTFFLSSPPHRQMDALNSSRKWLHVHPVGRPRSVGQNLLAWDHSYSHWVSYHIEYIGTLTCYQHSHSIRIGFIFQGKNRQSFKHIATEKRSLFPHPGTTHSSPQGPYTLSMKVWPLFA